MTSTDFEASVCRGVENDHGTHTGCHPGLLDRLRCHAKGIEAQAEYNAGHMEELTLARTQYDAARSAYGEAREQAVQTVADLRDQLDQMIDQIECLVDDPSQIQLINQAFELVKNKIAQCGTSSGCGLDDDDSIAGDSVDDNAHHCHPHHDIAGRIAELQRRTQAAKAVFDDLIKEPTNLPKRMTSLQQEIATIETDKAGDPQKTDFKRLYAAALVAGWHLDQIWRGFGNTNDYVSCLCRALKRQLRGHATIAVLLGRQAEHQCHRDAAAAHCVHLREQTVDEVMAQYVRLLAETAGGQAHGLAGGGEADPGAGAEGDRSLRRRRNRDRDRYGY